MELDVKIKGMTCDGCVRAVKKALERIPGVKQAVVTVGSAHVVSDPTVSRDRIAVGLADAGYAILD